MPCPYQSEALRWETATRWYEASIIRDLLGDWTVVRRWGGRTNRLNGRLIEVVADYEAACRRLNEIDAERRSRPTPYWESAHETQ